MSVQLEMILPDRAYAFFSHSHKAQKENIPLLDKVTLLMGAPLFTLVLISLIINLVVSDSLSHRFLLKGCLYMTMSLLWGIMGKD